MANETPQGAHQPSVLEVLERYETLAREADTLFGAIRSQHPECVACQMGCDDCCHALFDLSFVEAYYLNKKFNELFEGASRASLLERADEADRQGYKIKRRFHKEQAKGIADGEILHEAAKIRLRCPLLTKDSTCALYDHRPLTCRIYGVPFTIDGSSYTCGKSRFVAGAAYPTVRMEAIQDRLVKLSAELATALGSRYTELHTVFVPVSMALMNTYDDEYLGIQKDDGKEPAK